MLFFCKKSCCRIHRSRNLFPFIFIHLGTHQKPRFFCVRRMCQKMQIFAHVFCCMALKTTEKFCCYRFKGRLWIPLGEYPIVCNVPCKPPWLVFGESIREYLSPGYLEALYLIFGCFRGWGFPSILLRLAKGTHLEGLLVSQKECLAVPASRDNRLLIWA